MEIILVMNAKQIRNLAKKTTALLSAIAASSFLGLPALAQVNSNSTNDSLYNQSGQTSPSSGQYSVSCVPINSQSSTTGQTYTSSARSSTTSGVQEFPNQTDPRSVAPNGPQSGNVDAAGNIVGSVDNQTGNQETFSRRNNDNTVNSNVPTGDMPYGNTVSNSRVDNQSISTPVAPNGQLSQGGIGGPVDGTSSQTTQSNTTSNSTNTISNSTSSQTTGSGAYTYGSARNPLYGNVLGWGGSTTGGRANMMVSAAADPDWDVFDADNDDNDRVSSRYDNNRTSSNSDSQLQTSGVTSGGQAISGSTSDSTTLNPSQTMNSGTNLDNRNSSITSDNQLRTSGVTSGGQAINPSAQSNGQMMANCPPGMMLRQTSPDQSSPQGDMMPGQAAPNGRENR